MRAHLKRRVNETRRTKFHKIDDGRKIAGQTVRRAVTHRKKILDDLLRRIRFFQNRYRFAILGENILCFLAQFRRQRVKIPFLESVEGGKERHALRNRALTLYVAERTEVKQKTKLHCTEFGKHFRKFGLWRAIGKDLLELGPSGKFAVSNIVTSKQKFRASGVFEIILPGHPLLIVFLRRLEPFVAE